MIGGATQGKGLGEQCQGRRSDEGKCCSALMCCHTNQGCSANLSPPANSVRGNSPVERGCDGYCEPRHMHGPNTVQNERSAWIQAALLEERDLGVLLALVTLLLGVVSRSYQVRPTTLKQLSSILLEYLRHLGKFRSVRVCACGFFGRSCLFRVAHSASESRQGAIASEKSRLPSGL